MASSHNKCVQTFRTCFFFLFFLLLQTLLLPLLLLFACPFEIGSYFSLVVALKPGILQPRPLKYWNIGLHHHADSPGCSPRLPSTILHASIHWHCCSEAPRKPNDAISGASSRAEACPPTTVFTPELTPVLMQVSTSGHHSPLGSFLPSLSLFNIPSPLLKALKRRAVLLLCLPSCRSHVSRNSLLSIPGYHCCLRLAGASRNFSNCWVVLFSRNLAQSIPKPTFLLCCEQDFL